MHATVTILFLACVFSSPLHLLDYHSISPRDSVASPSTPRDVALVARACALLPTLNSYRIPRIPRIGIVCCSIFLII